MKLIIGLFRVAAILGPKIGNITDLHHEAMQVVHTMRFRSISYFAEMKICRKVMDLSLISHIHDALPLAGCLLFGWC